MQKQVNKTKQEHNYEQTKCFKNTRANYFSRFIVYK